MSSERKKLLLSVGVTVGATVAAVALIGQAAHFADLATRLRAAHVGWLVLCAAGEVAAYAGFVASYQAMAELDGGPHLTYPTDRADHLIRMMPGTTTRTDHRSEFCNPDPGGI